MFVEARVFDCQHGLLHQVRHFLDRCEIAVFFAEFADQHLVGRINAQRDLGAVIGDRFQRWQVGADHEGRIAGQGDAAGQAGEARADAGADDVTAVQPGRTIDQISSHSC